jgi:hypothetical protein
MKRRDFIKLVSAAGATSFGSGCFADSDRPNELSSTTDVLSSADLRCEYLVNPLGIDVQKPRLSWKLDSSIRGQKQTAYQILVASSPEKLTSNIGDL